MSHTIQDISLLNLGIGFVPMLFVLGFLIKWHMNYGNVVYAIARMVTQLLIIGYLLVFIFNTKNPWIVLGILFVMLVASGWIALGVVKQYQRKLLPNALTAIFTGGGVTLLVVTQGVLSLEPWYEPRYVIPLAGMIFANSMNTVSLAVERMTSETARGADYGAARNAAFQASLIPVINSLFAVGLVSLPGMMTGQILSGVSPLVAVRYQMVVMCMIFSSAGISSALFLILGKKYFNQQAD
ncbi:MAG: ABC transporter permease [Gammaproteobacteria bacterium]|jgi:putative ABC transport system permease protein